MIPVLAYGTEYSWGIPKRGFMVSLGVKGEGLNTILKRNEANASELWERYGEMCASPHAAGCMEPLRAKDLMVDEQVAS
jgi:hypothetical protein